jgi:hypothetical protein
MKALFKSLISISAFSFTQFSYANIVNQDIIQQSCSKNFNRYYSCDFSQFTSNNLTNTKIFTLPMDFKVSYSRGFCPNKFENGRYYSDYFYLYLSANNNNKAILSGNNRTKLTGNSLLLKDLNPAASYATEIYSPCLFIIRNVELDFSTEAKEEINSIQQRMNVAKSTFLKYKNIKEKSSTLVTSLNQLDLSRAILNLNELIDNLKQLEESHNSSIQDILTPQQILLLKNYNKMLSNLSNSNNNERFNRIAESIKIIINNLNTNIQSKESSNTHEFSQYQNDYLLLHKILHEAENESHFNQISLDNLKKMIGN